MNPETPPSIGFEPPSTLWVGPDGQLRSAIVADDHYVIPVDCTTEATLARTNHARPCSTPLNSDRSIAPPLGDDVLISLLPSVGSLQAVAERRAH